MPGVSGCWWPQLPLPLGRGQLMDLATREYLVAVEMAAGRRQRPGGGRMNSARGSASRRVVDSSAAC